MPAGSAERGDVARHAPREGARVPPETPQSRVGEDRYHPQIRQRAACRHAAVGGGRNPRRRAVRRPATLGLLSETRSRVAGTKAGNKGKIIFLSAICSGMLCGSPRASLPRLTAAESFECCCSPVENDIHSCQAFAAALGL